MTLDLWHVGLVVRDLDRAVQLYCGVLGFELRLQQVQRNEYTDRLVGYPNAHIRVAQLRFSDREPGRSGHAVELIEYINPVPDTVAPENARIGAAHLALEVRDIDALRAPLEDAGVTFLADPIDITEGVNRGGRTVYLRDPDGITLELCEAPPRQSDPR
jgi:catechol 2,3-dioxygenase-like lactoylglutathione lyase family enzyme